MLIGEISQYREKIYLRWAACDLRANGLGRIQFCVIIQPRGWRRVSTTLRRMLTEFSEFFHMSWTGLLIHASVGTGAFRTKRSG